VIHPLSSPNTLIGKYYNQFPKREKDFVWMQDARCMMHDTRYWMLDPECRIFDTGWTELFFTKR
jgi:hypothetical protein